MTGSRVKLRGRHWQLVAARFSKARHHAMRVIPRRIQLFVGHEFVLIPLLLQSQPHVLSQQLESKRFVFHFIDFFESHLSNLII